VKLSRQGAPDIRELDTNRLLEEGSWHYRERRPISAAHRPATVVVPAMGANRRRRRWPARTRP
jgi:hypothetical protein